MAPLGSRKEPHGAWAIQPRRVIQELGQFGAAALEGVAGSAEAEQLAGGTHRNCVGTHVVEVSLVLVGGLLEQFEGGSDGVAAEGVIH